MLCDKYLFQFEISSVKTRHAMCFRENNNGGSKRAYIAFHDVNSVLYRVTYIYPNAGIITVNKLLLF